MQRNIALGGLVLIIALINFQIWKKETHLAQGQIVYLKLAPVDPRSLMQGDYMVLHYEIANQVYAALPITQFRQQGTRHSLQSSDGYVVVSLDQRLVATFEFIYNNNKTLKEKQVLLRYRLRNGKVKFASNAYFFQEGHASIYENAKYGQFRVDDKGELLLVAMFNADLQQLSPPIAENKLQL